MYSKEQKKIKREYHISLMKEEGLISLINDFQNVLDAVQSNVFTSPKFDSYIKPRIRTCPGIISSIDTLDGIKELCEIGDYSDVYILIRKIRDNLFLDLFLFEAQKTLERIPVSSFDVFDLNNIDEIMNSIEAMTRLQVEKEKTSEELIAINKWKDDKLLINKDRKTKKKYFDFNKYITYLEENNNDFKECRKLFLEDFFAKLGSKLNDYVHSNSESIMINRQEPIPALLDIKETLIILEQLFIITLFFVDSTLLSSDDYRDCIESNISPLEGSQYLVNGYILEVFKDIKADYSDLFQFLTNNNRFFMKIDYE